MIRFSILLLLLTNINSFAQYVMPEETSEHEGTWLQWPHSYTYGSFYRNSLDNTWVEMTESLINSENVHIIAYNTTEKDRIIGLLNDANIPLTNVDFFIHETDDIWVRDNGPVFVYDENDNLTILDWGFNGWGNDTPFSKCDLIPSALSSEINLPLIDLSAMVLEGGAIEIDGNGTVIATRSSVTHSSRNPDLSETEIEEYLNSYLRITNFIWLDGVYGSELTDMHIDGFVKFANDSTIVTFNTADLEYWELSATDINTLYNATDINGKAYNFVYIPLTQNNVTTAYGNALDYKGSYCNYYIANTVVLVPNYNDPNDAVANAIIQGIYPTRTVIGIDVRNLYENGGMIHCVTQQQPVEISTSSINRIKNTNLKIGKSYPNPVKKKLFIELNLKTDSEISISIYDITGRKVKSKLNTKYSLGINTIIMNVNELQSGIYSYVILENEIPLENNLFIVE